MALPLPAGLTPAETAFLWPYTTTQPSPPYNPTAVAGALTAPAKPRDVSAATLADPAGLETILAAELASPEFGGILALPL
ncbi:hypothetical protein VE04_04613, partial [Pseudogymnoascus sp. 24MN13]